MNMLLTAVLVCLALSATAEPNKQTRQQLMEAKLREVHNVMTVQSEKIDEQEKNMKQLSLEIAALRNDKLENAKQRDAAVKDQLEMREQLQSTQLQYQQLRQELREELREELLRQELLRQELDTQSQVTSLHDQMTSLHNQITEVHDQVIEVQDSLKDAHQLTHGAASDERYSFLAELTEPIDDIHGSLDIVFDGEFFNRGSAYDSSTGEYTVPVDGIYLFTATVMLRDKKRHSLLHLRVDGANAAYTSSTEPATSTLYNTMSVTSLLQLRSGQKVSVQVDTVSHLYGYTSNTMFSWFGGHLIEQ